MSAVSIRAPREGGDLDMLRNDCLAKEFQSAPPVKGATRPIANELAPVAVSIRAPREGGDAGGCVYHFARDVSIRAPREGGDKVWKT